MKYFLLTALVVGFVFATPPRLIVEEPIIDNGLLNNSSGHGLRQATMIDSGTYYSLILTNQECLSYNPFVDRIAFVNRNFSPTGILNVHTAPGDLSYWFHDYGVYMQDYGPGRYPTAIAGTQGPYISFPWLVSPPAWGGAGAQYCSGGWFSGLWNSPVDIGPGDQKCSRVIGKELPDGNMCFILLCTDPWGLQYRTYNDSLTTLIDSGWLTPSDRYYLGWDCNITAGIAYVFYVDDNLNLFYRTTTDGVTWSAEQVYNLIWPNPYTNNLISLDHGLQAAVTDNGNPLIVFANMDQDDISYPQYGKVYVSHTEGQPCVEVSLPSELRNFYPTVATAGSYAAVTFLVPRDTQQDSAAFHDIHLAWSNDNGVNWYTPVNMTWWSTQRISCPQLAKRLDVSRGRPYIVYATCRLPEEDMDLMWAYNNGIMVTAYFNFMPDTNAIKETKTETPKKASFTLFPNPITNHSTISYTLSVAGNVSLKCFSVDGRLVKIIDNGHKSAGGYTKKLCTNELANGTYFFVLDTPEGNFSRSLVILH